MAAAAPELSAVWAEASALVGALGSAVAGGEQTEATNHNKGQLDAGVAMVFAAGLFVFNWGSRKGLLEPVARGLLLPPGATQAQVDKFGQSASEALFYGLSFVLGMFVVPRQPWIWPSALWWKDKPSGSHGELCDDLKCYILLYFARYFQGVFSCLLEHKRKDFIEMQIHHLSTITLIFVAYNNEYCRVGVVVMLLLDPADVPLHFAKLCKYTNRDGLADVFFHIFGVSFFVTRLVFYPYVVWSAHIEGQEFLPYAGAEWTCVGLLYVLLLLQLYWFSLIMKVVVKLINGGEVEDVRSDDEDEDGAGKKDD